MWRVYLFLAAYLVGFWVGYNLSQTVATVAPVTPVTPTEPIKPTAPVKAPVRRVYMQINLYRSRTQVGIQWQTNQDSDRPIPRYE